MGYVCLRLWFLFEKNKKKQKTDFTSQYPWSITKFLETKSVLCFLLIAALASCELEVRKVDGRIYWKILSLILEILLHTNQDISYYNKISYLRIAYKHSLQQFWQICLLFSFLVIHSLKNFFLLQINLTLSQIYLQITKKNLNLPK